MPAVSSHRPQACIAALLDAETRATLERELLPPYLVQRRWYGAKDAGAPAVQLLPPITFERDGAAALLTRVRAAPPAQAPQTYFLPLACAAEQESVPEAAVIGALRSGGDRLRVIDAAADDRFIRALLAGMQRADADADLVFRRTTAFRDDAHARADAPIERSRAQQSNTSIRIGGTMLKLFRRLQAGVHPEVEITAYLTEHSAFRNAPMLLGTIEWIAPDGAPSVLGSLQALIPNRGDGWSFVLERLARAEAPEERAMLVALATQLGRRTAELHRALAAATEDPAFAPEPVTPAHLARWSDAVGEQAHAALVGLQHAWPGLEDTPRALAARVLAGADALFERIEQLTADPVDAELTRLHNDFHLGQVLVSDEDVFIIDFEGEPLRPLAERRAKHSVLRDVAGMLRSFSYAAAAAARALPAEARAPAAPRLDAVASGMSQAFLGFYHDVIGDCPSFPPEPQARRLLELFLLEKALYEVNYELANRPDWIGIPLAGVVALLEGAATDLHS